MLELFYNILYGALLQMAKERQQPEKYILVCKTEANIYVWRKKIAGIDWWDEK